MFARQELETTVSQDGQIIIKFPESVPVGATVRITVEMQVIEPEKRTATTPINPAVAAARAKLAAAGMLGTAHMPPDDLVGPSEEEFLEIAKKASGGPSIAEILDEIRGER